jgi:dihydroorotase
MKSVKITNAKIVNEGSIIEGDVLVKNGRIAKIQAVISEGAEKEIDANGSYLLPGIIDDQVHFREPGLTHKATIYSESRAAVSGGITSFMEMPNTVPNALNQELLQDKYNIAQRSSLANYSFYMGASNNNLDEVLKTNPDNVCGIKIFMGSSTGNMLVDDSSVLETIFANSSMLIATHCEDEAIIRKNTEEHQKRYGSSIDIAMHAKIRSAEACYKSSSLAVELAKKFGSKLHVLHISTEKELKLFENKLPLREKRITAEACIHHLWFNDSAYADKGTLVKWNPAIKTEKDRQAIFDAVWRNTIDVIATDHAPHTLEEKKNQYFDAPSGGPLVQHALNAMMEFHLDGKVSMTRIVEKMCHNPAILFQVKERGFIREGYHADLVVVNPNSPWTVDKRNILAHCGWSPFEGQLFRSAVTHTLISGHLAFELGQFDETQKGQRLIFDRA